MNTQTVLLVAVPAVPTVFLGWVLGWFSSAVDSGRIMGKSSGRRKGIEENVGGAGDGADDHVVGVRDGVSCGSDLACGAGSGTAERVDVVVRGCGGCVREGRGGEGKKQRVDIEQQAGQGGIE